MMRYAAWICLAPCLLAAGATHAERKPVPGPGDPHVQTVAYDPDELVVLELPTGYQVTLQFAPDERIESVAVGDAAAWQASANRRGDYLFVKPIQQGVRTNMVVVTDARIYTFELAPAFGVTPTTPFTVRFLYPPAVQPGAEAAPAPASDPPAPIRPARPIRWRLTGARQLFPADILSRNDAIVIRWAPGAPLPAIYGIDAQGQERLVNAMVTERRLVLEPIWRAFVFRLQGKEAVARTVEGKK